MKCIVCEKPVAGSSNVCSSSCLMRAGPAGGKKGKAKRKSPAGIINDLVLASLEVRSNLWKDVPMIIIKHRWMKNRNKSFGTTNFSFDSDGIARVLDVGNARLDVEGYVRFSKGLAKVVVLTPPEPVSEPAPVRRRRPVPPKKAPQPQKVDTPKIEVVEEAPKEEKAPEPEPQKVEEEPKKKDTPKRKPPGRKSSKKRKK